MIDTQLLISGVIFGLSLGSIFFLMTIGLSLCFGLMRIISLDQLLYYSVGAYITFSVSAVLGNIWLGVIAGMIVAGLSALVVERVVFRRIYERDLPFTMITSFGVLIGGVGTLYGPLVGSIVYTGMKDVLSKVLGNWELVIGFVLVFIMLAGEKGIWGSLEPLIKKTFLRVTGNAVDREGSSR